MLYEMHMHTPLCKHAHGDPEEYAAIAQTRGLAGIVVTCHNPSEDDGWAPAVRMSVGEFDDYVALVERARQAWAGAVDIRLGIESDYVPGMEPWLEKLHGMADFHHVLGSVHPHLTDYRERFYTGDFDAFVETYFAHLAAAAESGLFDTLAHPDLVKTVAPDSWDLARASDPMRRSLDRIAATGTAMELNTSGLLKPPNEMNPSLHMLGEMQQRNIPVVLGSDAHNPRRVAAHFEEALDFLSEVGYKHTSIFLDRQRREIPIAQTRRELRKSIA